MPILEDLDAVVPEGPNLILIPKVEDPDQVHEVDRRTAVYFPQFMAFFFPDLYEKVDWSAGYENLEQELREVVRDAETGPRVVDKLVKVHTLSGKPVCVFIHIEIQVSHESGFPLRMFVYHYRLFDRYPEAVVSLAILGDEDPDCSPDRYDHELWGNSVAFTFRVAKLWEYNDRWAELEADPRPFAMVVMAHLKTKATRGQETSRLRWKIRLVRQLYERGYERREVLHLFRFIDWVLALPDELTQEFRDEVRKHEEELKMRYVTSIERLARVDVLERQLKCRFKEEIPDWVLPRLHKVTVAELDRWSEQILDAKRLEDVFATG